LQYDHHRPLQKPYSVVPEDDHNSEPESYTSTASSITRIDPRLISDAIIGLTDGLTVPFALTAGLPALGDTRVDMYGGLAELIAGAISMGVGGYLGAKERRVCP